MKKLLLLLLFLTFAVPVFADERADLLNQKEGIQKEIIFKQGELIGIQNMFKLYFQNLEERLQLIQKRLQELEKEKEKKE